MRTAVAAADQAFAAGSTLWREKFAAISKQNLPKWVGLTGALRLAVLCPAANGAKALPHARLEPALTTPAFLPAFLPAVRPAAIGDDGDATCGVKSRTLSADGGIAYNNLDVMISRFRGRGQEFGRYEKHLTRNT